ncbi:energy transducer TonB [Fulvivirga ulvae]|uniref:energy transducer TonB n=1 Tax=Fulvivirga ulvae TaxID=2904245 RepID=UPI001F2EE594|nr:energy transducer TonB [Fulvivirga ulvae]UII33650.1 energy transducer TonB [Fulvivirga ulvae]
MGKALTFLLLIILTINSFGQVKLDKFEKFECLNGFSVDYEFNKSHASIHAAGITIFDKKLDGGKLEIFLGFHGNCSDADNAGVRVIGDTIELLHGPNYTEKIEDDGSTSYEIEVALCDCCLNFKYFLSGLDPNINYVLKLTNNVADDYYGIPIDVVNNKTRSIYYPPQRDTEEMFLSYIHKATADYKLLFRLYSKFRVNRSSKKWDLKTQEINKTWREFLHTSKALKDPFVLEELGTQRYSELIKPFYDKVAQLTPKLCKEYERLQSKGIWRSWYVEEPLEIKITEEEREELLSSDFAYIIAEEQPELLISLDSIDQFINDKIAKKGNKFKDIEGKIYFEFVIGKDGSLLEKNIVKGIETAIDKFVEGQLQELDFRFKPAKMKGIEVKSKVILPIRIKRNPDLQ